MAKYYGVARDSLGNVIPEASVTVYDAGTTTPSSLYVDDTLAVATPSTFTGATDGSYEFFVDNGAYRVDVSKTGYTSYSEDNINVIGLIFSGTGSPEGVVTAGIGSLYLRRDGSTNTTLYVKEANTDNTGWAAK